MPSGTLGGVLLSTLLFMSAAAADEPCAAGFGRASDGNCYPLEGALPSSPSSKSQPSASSDCRWRSGDAVLADMTMVQVGDEVYGVVGETGRSAFESTLRSCDASSSTVMMFNQWRQSRLVTNITAGVGILVFPVWIGTGVVASQAGQQRLRFVESLGRDLEGS
jgi:hypothetical protein